AQKGRPGARRDRARRPPSAHHRRASVLASRPRHRLARPRIARLPGSRMPDRTIVPAVRSVSDDELDALDELPDLDDGGEGPEAGVGEEELPEDESRDTSTNPYDDETGEDDPVDPAELDDDGGETGWLEEAPDAEGLDLGASDMLTFDDD